MIKIDWYSSEFFFKGANSKALNFRDKIKLWYCGEFDALNYKIPYIIC